MTGPSLTELINRRLSRREMIGKTALAAAAFGLGCRHSCTPKQQEATSSPNKASQPRPRSFTEVAPGIDDHLHVPEGYQAQVLLAWGASLEDGSDFPGDLSRITADEQRQRFGTHCDFTAFLPLPDLDGVQRGLLCVNHELTIARVMFPDMPPGRRASAPLLSQAQCETELAAHGHSVVEIRLGPEGWRVVPSPLTRRFDGGSTPFELRGPAAGHARMQTSEDPSGRRVIGTVANCSGGVTPWGTVLIAEENVDNYFGGQLGDGQERANLERFGIDGRPDFGFWRFWDRFDVSKEPREPNRFGWMVEYDPRDPKRPPVKRTALGRFSHEGAACTVSEDGRAVLYMADDSGMEYLYRFVSDGPASAGGHLLDHGTLSVARFDSDGSVTWLDLIHGQGPLTKEHGFNDQGDVLIETRRAADRLGATPMDRPEGIAVDPKTGRVYVALTYNRYRAPEAVDAVHPRARDAHGQILEIMPPGPQGHGAKKMRWDALIRCGDPARHEGTKYGDGLTERGWVSCPDNLRFDPSGRLWVCTDGMERDGLTCDGIFLCPVAGEGRAVPRRFLRVPTGAECTGPSFTPDGRTLFVSIQHPGAHYDATLAKPRSRWPHQKEGRPPQPAVVAIRALDGGIIGGDPKEGV